MTIRNRFSPRKRQAHVPPEKKPLNPVQQSHLAGSDINSIVKRHYEGPGRFGLPIGSPHASRQPRFAVMPSQSYHDMLNQVTDMESNFKTLPAQLRGTFKNSVYVFLRWLENPLNRPKALELGLLMPTDEEAHQMRVARSQARARQKPQEPVQGDLVQEAQKADDEAQPSYAPPKGGKKGV